MFRRPLYSSLCVSSSPARNILCEEVHCTLSALFYRLRLPHDTGLDVRFVSPDAMHFLNKSFKSVDAPTDVLTFCDNDATLTDRYGNSLWEHVTSSRTLRSSSSQAAPSAKPDDELVFAPLGDFSLEDDLDDSLCLGEIFISVEYMETKLLHHPHRNLPLQQYFIAALIHAFCHAIGYDHAEDEDHLKMVAMEKMLLRYLRSRLIYSARCKPATAEAGMSRNDLAEAISLPSSFSLRIP